MSASRRSIAQAEKDAEYAKQNIRSESEYRLADPSLLQGFKEFADDITLQILSVFPTFVLQQIQNTIAVRQIVPRGTHRTDLNWTLIGFADDTPEQRLMRLKQANLVGPAGLRIDGGRVRGRLRAARHRRRQRRAGRRRDGRKRRRKQREPRDGGLGAGLLEGLSRRHGDVRGGSMARTSRA